MKLVIHIDGGSRGNPGPAAAGVVIADADTQQPLHEAGYHLGQTTNNVAEYMGLIKALDVVEQIGTANEITGVAIISDSQLMVRQINGQYKVKNANLKPLFQDAQKRLQKLTAWQIGHVKRELNKRADELANQAMDAGRDVVVIGEGAASSPATSSNETNAARPPAVTNEHSTATGLFRAYLTKKPGKQCPARCPAKTPFHFGDALPAGFCTYAAQAVFDENPTLWRESGTTQSQTQCPKCGVPIEIERTDS